MHRRWRHIEGMAGGCGTGHRAEKVCLARRIRIGGQCGLMLMLVRLCRCMFMQHVRQPHMAVQNTEQRLKQPHCKHDKQGATGAAPVQLRHPLPIQSAYRSAHRRVSGCRAPCHSNPFNSSALLRVMPGTAASSSTDAARIPSSEPKCFNSACRRRGPIPGISSRVERIADLLRSVR